MLYLWFPFLATELEIRRRSELASQPFVVTHLNKGTDRLVGLSPTAKAKGLKSGQSLADARSFISTLVSEPANPARAAQFLTLLARWSERFTPLVGLDGPFKVETGASQQDALVLDIQGVAHLFGGERAMLKRALLTFRRFGLSAQGCITETKTAARALCIFKSEHQIVPPNQVRQAVKDVSIQALEPSAKVTKQLTHLGLLTIEQIVNLPKGSLARRFGLDFVQRLNQMLGDTPDPIKPVKMARPNSVRLRFPEPLGLQDDLSAAAERVVTHLLQRLKTQTCGVRQLRLTLTSPNGLHEYVDLGFATPCTDLLVVMRLLEPKLDKIQSEFGFDEIRAQALQTNALIQSQASLIAEKYDTQEDALYQLFNVLGNRIGFERICQFVPVDSHLPEKRFALASYGAAIATPSTLKNRVSLSPRPLSSFLPEPLSRTPEMSCHYPPQTFQWRRRACQVLRATGPERITPPWWHKTSGWEKGARDYWQVETQDGDWLWMFTLPQQRDKASWFVSGRFH